LSIKRVLFKELSSEDQSLAEAAEHVMRNAYNPYSDFYVGAAALARSGQVYLGTFMDNASFGLTICAEPAALLAATTAGDLNIVRIAVVGGSPSKLGSGIVSPCGRCRQIIFEVSRVSGTDITVICCDGELKEAIVTTIGELLPAPFWNEELEQQASTFYSPSK
jgi:cytidine deaminase